VFVLGVIRGSAVWGWAEAHDMETSSEWEQSWVPQPPCEQ